MVMAESSMLTDDARFMVPPSKEKAKLGRKHFHRFKTPGPGPGAIAGKAGKMGEKPTCADVLAGR
jgi:hypothetical protein